jgi:Trk K+ transport system NAD-binding subunit
VFAASASVAGALLGTDGLQLVFVPILLLDLSLAVSIGFALGKFLALITRIRLPDIVIAGAILAIGYGVYEAADFVKSWSNTELGFEVYLEPLLLTLTAGATVANFTSRRARFEHVLGLVSPAVYVAFFTLTGLSLKLDTLIEILPVAMVVFLIRVVAIALGTTVGARIAREDGHLRNKSWLAMITQAGIALGLAREAAIQFPALGDSFATLIVAVIVLNEIFGPMLLKFVLGRVDEAGDKDGRRVLIHGIDRNAIRLAERLEGQGWSTQLSDTRADHVDEVDQTREWKVIARNTAKRYFAEIDELPDTVVAMSGDDESNLELCRAATEAGVARTVARVQESGLLDDFHEIGTLVIDPTRAAVALFEDAVRTPDAAELVLHNDANRETRQVRIRSRFAHGRSVRDLRLPAGVLVLAIRRDGATVTPDGFTRVRRGDDVTLIGEPGLLREATNRLTY